MTDYFFISSPLHVLMAANVSLQNPQNDKKAAVVSKSPAAGARTAELLRRFPDLFGGVLDLSAGRAAAFAALRAEFSRPGPARLFAGNDRRIEFQFAMHLASRGGQTPEGIYLDEGAVTYVGHKSMFRIAHRFLDPAFKKIRYGFWYRPALTTGTSAWIQTACVAFPDLVHPLLKTKRIVAIDPAPFKLPRFKDLACAMLAGHDEYRDRLRGIGAVLTLPHEAAYLHRPEPYREIFRQLQVRFPASEIAIKPHPRIAQPAVLPELFPGALQLDHAVGMEALLPLLKDDCVVVGDVSSTLLTTRWLRPDLPVVALSGQAEPPQVLRRLYDSLRIPLVAPEQLSAWLAR